MDLDLISKKELLELTGISYGQLYRWKRKNLIPEDWFIRRSTFTGQETFFPREKILGRINKIIHGKDELSLDELADLFSPTMTGALLTQDDILKRNIVSKVAFDLFIQQQGEARAYPFYKVLYAYVLDRLLVTGELSLPEGTDLLKVMEEHYPKFQGKHCELIFMRKMGVSMFALAASPHEMYVDSGVKIVSRLNLTNCIEELKAKWM